jgi:hypothetical protein
MNYGPTFFINSDSILKFWDILAPKNCFVIYFSRFLDPELTGEERPQFGIKLSCFGVLAACFSMIFIMTGM